MKHSGVLERIGSSTTNLSNDMTKIDSISIGGNPELRNITTTRYLADHLSSALGEPCSMVIAGNVLFAVGYQGRSFSEVGFKTIINAYLWRILLAWPALFALMLVWNSVAGTILSPLGGLGNIITGLITMPLYVMAMFAPLVAYFFFTFRVKSAVKELRPA